MNSVKLGDICTFINGGSWNEKAYVRNGIPVLKVSNCRNNGFQIEDLDYLPETLREKYKQNELHLNDVIIATVGSHPNLKDSAAGRCAIVSSLVEGFYLNQNAVCLRTKDNTILDQIYLGVLCRYFPFQHYIQMRGKGAANQMRIAIGSIKEYKFNLPDIGVQKRIADILSNYDFLIENNLEQIKLLEEAARRLYREWFVDLHFPGYEKSLITNGIPRGWKKERASNLLTVSRGKSYSSAELSAEEGILLINLSNIQAFGGYNRQQEKRFSGKYKEEQLVCPNDLIMGVTDMTQERRTVGRVALIPKLHEKAIISMDLIKLEPHNGSTLFYYAMFRYGDYGELISRFANGTNVLHLRPEALSRIEVLMPTIEIQDLYTREFSLIQEQINVLQDQIISATEARDRLLPKLLSGEIEL